MNDSIIAAVSQLLTPDVMSKLAGATGLDAAAAQKAVDASVPAILGGLADLAGKPGGARQLSSAIAEHPANFLSTLTSAVSGNGQLQQKGTSTLASLLGGDTLGTLVSGVSKSAGIGEGSARALMGYLTPVVLGALGSQQRAAGMEASGLARMLKDQKNQITAAMPAGFSSMSNASGLPPSAPSPRHEAHIQDAPQAAHARYHLADVQTAATDAATKTGSSWAYWALPLLAVAGLLWYLLPSGQIADPAVKTGATSSSTARLLPSPDDKAFYLARTPAGWRSVGTYYNQDIYDRAGEKIGRVKDLLVGPDGKINTAVIGIGHFLGIGEKDIAVPVAALSVQERENARQLTIDIAKNILKTAPSFDSTGTR